MSPSATTVRWFFCFHKQIEMCNADWLFLWTLLYGCRWDVSCHTAQVLTNRKMAATFSAVKLISSEIVSNQTMLLRCFHCPVLVISHSLSQFPPPLFLSRCSDRSDTHRWMFSVFPTTWIVREAVEDLSLWWWWWWCIRDGPKGLQCNGLGEYQRKQPEQVPNKLPLLSLSFFFPFPSITFSVSESDSRSSWKSSCDENFWIMNYLNSTSNGIPHAT